MKVYSPAEVADILKIKQPTLRKYSILLEERGYKIERNSQNHRYYRDDDIITLRRVITGKDSGVTLEKAIDNVLHLGEDNTYTNDTNNDVIPNDNDMNAIKELKSMIHTQTELINKQNQSIQELTNRLDQQQDYIKQSMEQRDKALMQTMNDILEQRKQIAAAEEEKKGFFANLFKKKKP